jgi:hypothetical protein
VSDSLRTEQEVGEVARVAEDRLIAGHAVEKAILRLHEAHDQLVEPPKVPSDSGAKGDRVAAAVLQVQEIQCTVCNRCSRQRHLVEEIGQPGDLARPTRIAPRQRGRTKFGTQVVRLSNYGCLLAAVLQQDSGTDVSYAAP